MIYSKFKVAGLHFLLSLVIISLILGAIIYFWFPDAMMKVSNFKEISILIISIDIVLGPLLTFIVFKPKKKSLKFDLSTIALIQISALVFGVYNLYQAHPVYIAFNVDRFTLVSAVNAKPERAKLKEFNISKLSSPKIVVSKLPENIDEKNSLILSSLEKGDSDFELRSEYYHTFEDNIDDILAKSLDPDIVFKKPEKQKKLNSFIQKHGKSKEHYAYLPLEGDLKDVIWVLDKKTAEPIDIIPVNPWIGEMTTK